MSTMSTDGAPAGEGDRVSHRTIDLRGRPPAGGGRPARGRSARLRARGGEARHELGDLAAQRAGSLEVIVELLGARGRCGRRARAPRRARGRPARRTRPRGARRRERARTRRGRRRRPVRRSPRSARSAQRSRGGRGDRASSSWTCPSCAAAPRPRPVSDGLPRLATGCDALLRRQHVRQRLGVVGFRHGRADRRLLRRRLPARGALDAVHGADHGVDRVVESVVGHRRDGTRVGRSARLERSPARLRARGRARRSPGGTRCPGSRS